MIAAIVDWEGLLDVAIASFVAGVGVTAVYAIAVLSVTRVLEASRDGRVVQAGVYGALAVVTFAAVVAACAFGIFALTQ